MSDLLIRAMTAKQSGDINLAKQLLSQAIVQDTRNEAAWMLLAEVVDDAKQRKNCLERVLAINPNNAAANQELLKLNTTPLEPPFHTERNKPDEAPQGDKTPPFTPPFTWDGKPEQYLALGELTFPDMGGEEEEKLPETPPTFDWANESPEPDKTMDKIFETVSKPELASQPTPEKETSWLDELRPDEEIVETPAPAEKIEQKKSGGDPWLQELVSSDTATVQDLQPLTDDDFSVSAEPQLGLEAFASSETAPPASAESDSLLWDNPHAKNDRLVILSYRSLIYAHPREDEIQNIFEMYQQNRMVRGMLGDKAYMIKLESIERITVNPKSANMIIEYKPNGKLISHQLVFSSPQVRDEVMTALKFRVGAGFKQSTRTTTMEDKILSPIVVIILVAILAWGSIWGISLLSSLPGFANESAQAVFSTIIQAIKQVGAVRIIILAVVIAIGCVIWLLNNLRKPSNEVILKR